VIALEIVLLLAYFGAALWLVPKVIRRSIRKIPSRVPQDWVDEYHSGSR
jgi:hypothetical protein